MAEVNTIENLVAMRTLLKTSLENSRALASALEKTGARLEGINNRLPSLEVAFISAHKQKCAFLAVRDHIDRAICPAAAFIKVFGAVRELEESLLSDPRPDIFTYISVMKKIEEAMKFLNDNCRLAIQWLEGTLEVLQENAVFNDRCRCNVMKCLQILRELQLTDRCAHLNGGILFAALDKLEIEFKWLLTENSFPFHLTSLSSCTGEQTCIASPSKTVTDIPKLQAVVARLCANSRIQKCLQVYVDIRSLNAKRSLQALDLDYLEKSITEFDYVQELEGSINQWCKHLDLAVKHVFEPEFRLCKEVFNIGADVWMCCFSEIAVQSGILSFLQFGMNVTQCKKEPIKLLKLLDIFAALDNLRVDFNRLFGGEPCAEIQTLTRDLIKRVVNGACEIFWELTLQVELQRQSSPPPDGRVPALVCFVTDYCNQLLGEHYRPILTQVLGIYQNWKYENYEEALLTNQIYQIIKEIGLNLDSWSKGLDDISLSYLFMMNNHCHFYHLKGTKVGEMMGDSWIRAHEQYRDYYSALYLRESWGKLLPIINQDGQILSGPAGNDLVKKRLKTFNEVFDGMYKKQSSWVVADECLRQKICQLVVQAFLPVYRSYLQKYEQDPSAPKYVKYHTAKSLKNMLTTLFHPKLNKCASNQQIHLIGKQEDIVKDQFHFTLMAVPV
ncbi:Exo70 domain-containing protein [Cephalotus follicularis]|uniref:Exocyst subunit Exo70 family protein n=1 Tax=Cephalotus follicularis TaxID=3775 RepID=A0A1Q3DDS9_CEPFO|nr:Exo70 domain-containing protein [Cephalotus follicularis]